MDIRCDLSCLRIWEALEERRHRSAKRASDGRERYYLAHRRKGQRRVYRRK